MSSTILTTTETPKVSVVTTRKRKLIVNPHTDCTREERIESIIGICDKNVTILQGLYQTERHLANFYIQRRDEATTDEEHERLSDLVNILEEQCRNIHIAYRNATRHRSSTLADLDDDAIISEHERACSDRRRTLSICTKVATENLLAFHKHSMMISHIKSEHVDDNCAQDTAE